MQVTIRLSAALAQVAGQPRLLLTLAEHATVDDAIRNLVQRVDGLEGKLAVAIPFVAGQQATSSTVLQDGQELALLMPAAGGMA